jgi:replication factor A1
MSSFILTTGSLEQIMAGEVIDKPVLQVLGQKKIAGTSGPDRYRMLLSDGKYSHSSAMLATQLNDKITNGELDNNAVVRLDKYICNPIQADRRVIIILEVTILGSGSEVASRIGNPVPLRGGAGAGGDRGDQSGLQSHHQAPHDSNSVGQAPITEPTSAGVPSTVSFTSANQSKALNNSSGSTTPAQQPRNNSRVYNGGAPTGFVDTPSNIHPIASLTPYQNRWTIRGRITQKSNVRTWSNSRGEGKLFNIVIVDESGEIRATAFTQEVEKFYNLIEVNKVYYIRKGVLKTADKRYSSIANDYEMTFSSETEVIPCDDSEAVNLNLPSLNFSFIPISQLEGHQPNSTIDVIGIAKSVDDMRMLTSKQGKELKKRDIVLVDESQVQIRLTLWAGDAELFDGTGHPVVAVKGCRLSDWGGRSLSALSSSQIIINPDIPEAHQLRGWYDSVGSGASYSEYKREGDQGPAGAGSNNATNWKTFSEVKAQNLGQDKPDYFTSKGTIVFMKKENCMYMACPTAECNKKVVDNGNGSYRCEKCQREYPNFKWRMILSVNLADFSDNHWVTCFQETAEQILGKKADEIGQLKDSDETAFDHLFAEANFKSFVFRLRSKMETFNDENRLKTVCVQASAVGCREYNQKLITDIEAMLGTVE